MRNGKEDVPLPMPIAVAKNKGRTPRTLLIVVQVDDTGEAGRYGEKR
jgi:hypothetical protein